MMRFPGSRQGAGRIAARAALLRSVALAAVLVLGLIGASRFAAAAQPADEDRSTVTQIADARQDAAKEYFAQGYKLYGEGLYYEAIDKFRFGFKLDPDNQAAHYYVAVAMKEAGLAMVDQEIAEHLLTAVQLDPDTKEGILAQVLLDEMEQRFRAHWQLFAGRWCLDPVSARLDPEWVVPESPETLELVFNERGWVIAVAWQLGARRFVDEFDGVTYGDSAYVRYLVSTAGEDSPDYDFSFEDDVSFAVSGEDRIPFNPPALEVNTSSGGADGHNGLAYYTRCE